MTSSTTGYAFSLNNQRFTARSVPGSSRLRITTDSNRFIGAFEPKWLRQTNLRSGYWTSLGPQINTELLLQLERIALVINQQRLIHWAKENNRALSPELKQVDTLAQLPENCELHFNCDKPE